MSGSGATIGLQQIITTMPRLIIPKVLKMVSITWCGVARGIVVNGVRVVSEPLLVFDTISRVIHSAFA